MIQITLTPKMSTAQVVETSVTIKNSPIQDYVHRTIILNLLMKDVNNQLPLNLFFLLRLLFFHNSNRNTCHVLSITKEDHFKTQSAMLLLTVILFSQRGKKKIFNSKTHAIDS